MQETTLNVDYTSRTKASPITDFRDKQETEIFLQTCQTDITTKIR